MTDTSDPFAAFMPEKPLRDYPGKRKPMMRPADVAPDVHDEQRWDANPKVIIHRDKAKEFFTIGHLSLALNRATVTIRSWEKKGVLPKSPFRSPPPRVSTVNGDPKGKRLWTREQIEGILDIAEQEGCIVDARQSPPTKEFTARVQQLFNEILSEETKETSNGT
jgi:hypothetical protein